MITPLAKHGSTVFTLLAAGIAVTTSFMAMGANTPPSITIPPVNLSSDPLYAAKPTDKPAMALALSVEYPTVGAQYVSVPNSNTDNSYANTNEYLGYYDAEGCYAYNDAPTDTRATGQTVADYKRFYRTSDAAARKCTDAFSGNFLNWATNSAVDMLRLALSGGDRYIDTPDLTVLQRAVLPNNDPVCMWNSNNFPGKRLSRNGGGANSYWGAIPQRMIREARENDIHIANTLNRIYIRASANMSGSCDDTFAYARMGVLESRETARDSGTSRCAGENENCTFTGVREVWYGAGSRWAVAPVKDTFVCNNANFGDPAPGVAKACFTRDYTGTWRVGMGLNSDGFFYSRVQVCNTRTDGTLEENRGYSFCQRYPNGKHKPTGVIQKYSEQIRLAAFGYLMDQSASYANNNTGRYGGVLRAPMKYVGQKTFDTNGRENAAANSRAEWNANTGVFNINSESDSTFGVSGVISYLNQFGRTGPTPGRYKIHDPVGELYYQALRYMQGLPPTADAVSNIGAAAKTNVLFDGFPVYSDWTNIDPYGDGRSKTDSYSCLRSNIVVIGDIHTHDGNWRNIPTSHNPAGNVQDFRFWHQIVRGFENNQNLAYTDGQGASQRTGNPNGANGNVPSSSQTSQIMGYAYWAHTQDIRGAAWTNEPNKQRPGLRVKTFIFDVNEYGRQNDANARRFSNQFFMAAKYGGFETDASNSGARPFNTRGNPFQANDGTNNNNVWQKAADPGEASTYFLQSDARGVLNAFDEIFARSAASARSIAGGASAARGVTASTGSSFYSARFDATSWTGDVTAEPITATSSSISVGSQQWSAAQRLKFITPANRKIFVGHGGTTAATAFTWSAISGTALQEHLNKPSPSAVADNRGSDRLDYLRGVQTNETGSTAFRARTELLGDIINSGVTYSGPPSTGFSGASYALFRTEKANRSPVVFAGANDGMLHAFAATTESGKSITAGDELFAYIPSWMGPKLSALTATNYLNNHQSYVDAPSVVGEAQVAFTAGAGASTDWKTVLVSGTGAGGRGVFALDVSTPESFTASNALWEFSSADDDDMGYVVGRPQILKFKTGDNTYRWFAVVASGVNNYTSSFTNGGGSGRPSIFLLALDKASNAAWLEGTNYYKISLPFASDVAQNYATGVVSFSPLYARGGEVTHIYAGDLHGKLWKLDFTDAARNSGYKDPSNWNMLRLSSFKNGSTPYPMFAAKDSTGTPQPQPITTAPTLFAGPLVRGVSTFYVLIGTGKYLESSDNLSTQVQTVYALYDDGSTSADATGPTAAISGRGRLRAGTVDTTTNVVAVTAFTWGRAASDSDATQRSGWYVDLPGAGEKMFTDATALSSRLALFSTGIPGSSGSAASCSPAEGSGRQYTVNIATGAGRTQPSLVGMLGANLAVINDQKTTQTAFDSTGRAVRTVSKSSIQLGSKGVAVGQETMEQETVGRLSWRQIYNYRELKNAGTTP
ncbi:MULTISPECIES: PilC/PilY family type IV pilus protein [unclassified Acidovorax]|uniref:pilus assembly protein n=1 Tax=unclassified Acidovorax TaxID=2684926 RepID=UPI00288355FF|nr:MULTISPECIES: PilC/PilY family type IV pilus protein [unclassified Acidovorax]